MALTAAIAGTRPSRMLGEPWSRPVARPMPPSARKPTLARLVSRKKATVRRAMKAVGRPPRRRIQAPSARPPAPPTDRTELAASSDSPISVLVRQLIRRQKTPRKTRTYPAQEPSCRTAASAIHSGCAPAKRSRSEPSPGTSTISATTPRTIAPTISSERRRLDGENSSGSASASSIGSRYSTATTDPLLMRRPRPWEPTLARGYCSRRATSSSRRSSSRPLPTASSSAAQNSTRPRPSRTRSSVSRRPASPESRRLTIASRRAVAVS